MLLTLATLAQTPELMWSWLDKPTCARTEYYSFWHGRCVGCLEFDRR